MLANQARLDLSVFCSFIILQPVLDLLTSLASLY